MEPELPINKNEQVVEPASESIPKQEIIITKKKAPSNKKGLKVILIIVAALMAIMIGGGVFLWHAYKKSIYSPNEYYIVAQELNVVERSKSPSGDDVFTVFKKMPYGASFALDPNNTIESKNKKYFKIIPFAEEGDYILKGKVKAGNYYLEINADDDIVDNYTYIFYYNKIFTTKETQRLATHIKKAIFDYVYNRDETLVFTQNPDRIKHVIAYADFDTDGEDDIAVILESSETTNSASKLLVLCYNSDIGKSYIAYEGYTDYGSKPIIKTFKKDALIFMNSETLVKAPNNGIIIDYPAASSTQKRAVLYNPKIKQFEDFLQMPKSEIEKQNQYDEKSEYEHETESVAEEDLG